MLHLNRRLIIEHAAALRLPAVYQWPETAEEGGLLGYGPSFIEVFRERARLVAKVLPGAKPADLPIEQPTATDQSKERQGNQLHGPDWSGTASRQGDRINCDVRYWHKADMTRKKSVVKFRSC